MKILDISDPANTLVVGEHSGGSVSTIESNPTAAIRTYQGQQFDSTTSSIAIGDTFTVTWESVSISLGSTTATTVTSGSPANFFATVVRVLASTRDFANLVVRFTITDSTFGTSEWLNVAIGPYGIAVLHATYLWRSARSFTVAAAVNVPRLHVRVQTP
jgi:hypothetical protein